MDKYTHDFREAIKARDITKLYNMIQLNQVNLNYIDDNYDNLLYKVNDYKVTRLLLYHKVNPHHCNRFGMTPLHVAYDAQITRLLLQYKADPNICDLNGWTPLHFAKDAQCIALLLEAKAYPMFPANTYPGLPYSLPKKYYSYHKTMPIRESQGVKPFIYSNKYDHNNGIHIYNNSTCCIDDISADKNNNDDGDIHIPTYDSKYDFIHMASCDGDRHSTNKLYISVSHPYSLPSGIRLMTKYRERILQHRSKQGYHSRSKVSADVLSVYKTDTNKTRIPFFPDHSILYPLSKDEYMDYIEYNNLNVNPICSQEYILTPGIQPIHLVQDKQSLQLLLDAKANPNIYTEYIDPLLLISYDPNIIQLLLDYKANPNIVSREGFVPLTRYRPNIQQHQYKSSQYYPLSYNTNDNIAKYNNNKYVIMQLLLHYKANPDKTLYIASPPRIGIMNGLNIDNNTSISRKSDYDHEEDNTLKDENKTHLIKSIRDYHTDQDILQLLLSHSTTKRSDKA